MTYEAEQNIDLDYRESREQTQKSAQISDELIIDFSALNSFENDLYLQARATTERKTDLIDELEELYEDALYAEQDQRWELMMDFTQSRAKAEILEPFVNNWMNDFPTEF